MNVKLALIKILKACQSENFINHSEKEKKGGIKKLCNKFLKQLVHM